MVLAGAGAGASQIDISALIKTATRTRRQMMAHAIMALGRSVGRGSEKARRRSRMTASDCVPSWNLSRPFWAATIRLLAALFLRAASWGRFFARCARLTRRWTLLVGLGHVMMRVGELGHIVALPAHRTDANVRMRRVGARFVQGLLNGRQFGHVRERICLSEPEHQGFLPRTRRRCTQAPVFQILSRARVFEAAATNPAS